MATLPTPPRPRQDDKENLSSSPSKKSIEWCLKKQVKVFDIENVIHSPKRSSSSSIPPTKSILKPNRPLKPFPLVKARDITPRPENAPDNSSYLNWPLSVILNDASTLHEITEAYSILSARIRESVPAQFWIVEDDKEYSLFYPLRRQANALAAAIVRDMSRLSRDSLAVPGPSTSPSAKGDNDCAKELPTPRNTPSPKKGGMTEEQVKHSRDLSTVTLATARFLVISLSVKSIFGVFSDDNLRDILSGVLSVPLEQTIRSPSSRKIYGIAMMVLQSQRLPGRILDSAKERVVLAITKGIMGELGREGKKGAVNESLKGFHDMSVYQPEIFMPSFVKILPCVLDALLSPTLTLRVQAAHALGGFVLGFTQCSQYAVLCGHISDIVVDFFMQAEPSTSGPRTTLRRTLQTTLQTLNPTHHAQGPFWAICVLASVIVLAGPALHTNFTFLRDVHSTLKLGLGSTKKMIRVSTSMLWCPLIWAWQKHRSTTVESTTDSDVTMPERNRASGYLNKILVSQSRVPIGVVLVGALQGKAGQEVRKADIAFMLYSLRCAADHGGDSTQRSLEILDRLVNTTGTRPAYDDKWAAKFDAKLLCPQLFSVSPGILTAELNAMAAPIEEIILLQPDLDDVRPYTDDEGAQSSIWTRTREIWTVCLEKLQISNNEALPELILDIWAGLLRLKMTTVKGKDDSSNHLASAVAEACADTLTGIFSNDAIDLRENLENAKEAAGPLSASALSLKLRLVRVLWSTATRIISATTLRHAIKPMLRYLVSNHRRLVPADDEDRTALNEWVQLAAQVATVGSDEVARVLWTTEWDWDIQTRSRVWRSFARGWTEDGRGSWRGAAIILGLPFENAHPWDMNDADLSEWKSVLSYTIDKAKESGLDRMSALNIVSGYIDHQHIVTMSSSVRVADFLLDALNQSLEESPVLPITLLDYVHEVLQTNYPPEPRNKLVALWLLRTIQTIINNCPVKLVAHLLEILHDGLCIWLRDESNIFSAREYSLDVVPIYQTILVALQPLTPSQQLLQSVAGLLLSALQSSDNSEAVESFQEFWQNCCSNTDPPKGGWADSLKEALQIANCSTSEETDGTARQADDLDELDVLPRRATAHLNGLNMSKSSFSLRNTRTVGLGPPLPSTPDRPTIAKASRPKRIYTAVPFLPWESPSSSSPSRRAARRASLKTSTVEEMEKENVSPCYVRGTISLAKRKAPLDVGGDFGKRRRTAGSDDCLARSAESDEYESDCDAVEAALPLVDSDDNIPSGLLSNNARPVLSAVSYAHQKLNEQMGSRARPIVVDPPSPTKRPRADYLDAIPPRSRAAKLSRYAYDPPSSDISEASSSPCPKTPRSRNLSAPCCISGVDSDPPSDDLVAMQSPSRTFASHYLSRSTSIASMRSMADAATKGVRSFVHELPRISG